MIVTMSVAMRLMRKRGCRSIDTSSVMMSAHTQRYSAQGWSNRELALDCSCGVAKKARQPQNYDTGQTNCYDERNRILDQKCMPLFVIHIRDSMPRFIRDLSRCHLRRFLSGSSTWITSRSHLPFMAKRYVRVESGIVSPIWLHSQVELLPL